MYTLSWFGIAWGCVGGTLVCVSNYPEFVRARCVALLLHVLLRAGVVASQLGRVLWGNELCIWTRHAQGGRSGDEGRWV